MPDSGPIPTVTIKRDFTLHSWVHVGMGTHKPELPWSDETPADSVVRYIKMRANGPIKVQVDLG